MSKIAPHSIGRYEVVAPLASGGMGELFLARRSGAAGFARLVVLKRLRPELGATATYRDMFFDEARLAARLTHPNVCEVYDLEEHGDDHFLAMPYLEGVPASELLPPVGPPERPVDVAHVRLVAGILVQVCDGLHHAHELRGDDGAPLGVVHRDVSPGNVFVTTDGVVKLLDFGVAKVRGATATTDQGVVKGKLSYMAPEQLAGGVVDRRADLFCVGILAWEGLCGRPLFARGSPSLTAAAVLDEPIAPVDGAGDAVPVELVGVVGRMLSRDPRRRPETAALLREEIEGAVAGIGGPAKPAELARVVAERCAETITAQRARVRGVVAVAAVAVEGGEAAVGEGAVGDRERVTVAAKPDALATTVWARDGGARGGGTFALAAALVGAVVGVLAIVAIVLLVTARGGGARKAQAATTDAGEAVEMQDARVAVAVEVGEVVEVVERGADGSDAGTGAGAGAGAGTGAGTGRREKQRLETGRVSIDSTPWAELFVDGKRVGITPYIDKPMAAGKHSVRAVLEDGRARTFSVTVPEGHAAAPVTLRW